MIAITKVGPAGNTSMSYPMTRVIIEHVSHSQVVLHTLAAVKSDG